MNKPLFEIGGYYIYPLAIIFVVAILISLFLLIFIIRTILKRSNSEDVYERKLQKQELKAQRAEEKALRNAEKQKAKTEVKKANKTKKERPKKVKKETPILEEESVSSDPFADLMDDFEETEEVYEEVKNTPKPVEKVIDKEKDNIGFVYYDSQYGEYLHLNKITDWQKQNINNLLDEVIREYDQEDSGNVNYYNWLITLKAYVSGKNYWDLNYLNKKDIKAITTLNFLLFEEALHNLEEGQGSEASLWLHALDVSNGGFEKELKSWFDDSVQPFDSPHDLDLFDSYLVSILFKAITYVERYIDIDHGKINPNDEMASSKLLTYTEKDFIKYKGQLSNAKTLEGIELDFSEFLVHVALYKLYKDIEETDSSVEKASLQEETISLIRAIVSINEDIPYPVYLGEISVVGEDV